MPTNDSLKNIFKANACMESVIIQNTFKTRQYHRKNPTLWQGLLPSHNLGQWAIGARYFSGAAVSDMPMVAFQLVLVFKSCSNKTG